MNQCVRCLRIGWTAICGVLCVLLIGLWVRSYWRWDVESIYWPGTYSYALESLHGRLFIVGTYAPDGNGFFSYSLPAPLHCDLDSYANSFGFAFAIGPTVEWFGAPYWSLLTAAVAFAVGPWTAWSKRFSLRTLLVATTLVAIVLGLIVWGLRA